MNFEEAGRTIEDELNRVLEKLEGAWKNSARPELIAQLRKASHTFADLAERLEKSARSEPRT